MSLHVQCLVCVSVCLMGHKWAVQKRRNRSRCRLGADLCGPRDHILDGVKIEWFHSQPLGDAAFCQITLDTYLFLSLHDFRRNVWITNIEERQNARKSVFITTLFISPPGIAMSSAGLCFVYVTLFFMSSLSFDNGWTDCCINTVNEKFLRLKFGELWSSNPLDLVAHLHGCCLEEG